MFSSASTKASVSNKMSFWWKIEVTRVQVFSSWVATKQNKRLPAGTMEKKKKKESITTKTLQENLNNNKWKRLSSMIDQLFNFLLEEQDKKSLQLHRSKPQKASYWKDQVPKKKGLELTGL